MDQSQAGLFAFSGRQLVAALLVIYGPRTTALLAVDGSTFDLQLDADDGDPVVLRGPCSIRKEGAKIFSPANLRAAQDLPAYNKMVQQWMEKRYTLRYTGAHLLLNFSCRSSLNTEACGKNSQQQGSRSSTTFYRVPIAF